MVDLEYCKAGMRIAVGEGVEPRPEEDELGGVVTDGRCQRLLGKAAARRHERAHAPPVLSFLRLEPLPQCLGASVAQNGDCQRIGEYQRLVENLMRRPIRRGPERGARGGERLQTALRPQAAAPVLRPAGAGEVAAHDALHVQPPRLAYLRRW